MPGDSEMERLLRDPEPGPEAHLLRGEEEELLRKAVLRIPPQLRIVLVLHDMEELNTEEVARILNLQPGRCVSACIARGSACERKSAGASAVRRGR